MTKELDSAAALGIIEVIGSVAAIVAADAMMKAASVVIVSRVQVGGGWVAITVSGDIASVGAALAAGGDAARTMGGTSVTSTTLGRPGTGVAELLAPAAGSAPTPARSSKSEPTAGTEPAPEPAPEPPSQTKARRRSGPPSKR